MSQPIFFMAKLINLWLQNVWIFPRFFLSFGFLFNLSYCLPFLTIKLHLIFQCEKSFVQFFMGKFILLWCLKFTMEVIHGRHIFFCAYASMMRDKRNSEKSTLNLIFLDIFCSKLKIE